MTEMKSTTKFFFSDGMVKKAIKRVTFPAMIVGQKIQFTSDVIDGEISLLLSKQSMKQADTQIDFSNHGVNMLEKNLRLHFTASGHHAISIGNSAIEEDLYF